MKFKTKLELCIVYKINSKKFKFERVLEYHSILRRNHNSNNFWGAYKGPSLSSVLLGLQETNLELGWALEKIVETMCNKK